MALPVGHSLVGAIAAKKTKNNLLEVLIFANLPDIDYFFGLFINGNMISYHRSDLTHSPLFALLVALIYWSFNKFVRRAEKSLQTLGVFLIVLSHWFIDSYFPFLYIFNESVGRNGFWDFVFAHILSFEFLYNNLIDLVFYGALYLLIVGLIFRLNPFNNFFKGK